MQKKINILTLGDCASNGNNTFGHLVYNEPDIILTYSLQFYKKYDDTLNWVVNNKILHFDDGISLEEKHDISVKKYRTEEKKISWPSLLPYNTDNLSLNGNHYGNYIKQLEKYCENVKKPDIVLITDYSPSHMFIYFTDRGKKYKFLTEADMVKEQYNKTKHNFPEHVHRKKRYFIQKQNSYRPSYQKNKNRRYFSLLVEKLNQLKIDYFFVSLRKENKTFDHPSKVIDLSGVRDQWSVGDESNREFGEFSKLKYDLQPICAKIVQQRIEEYYNNIDKNNNLM